MILVRREVEIFFCLRSAYAVSTREYASTIYSTSPPKECQLLAKLSIHTVLTDKLKSLSGSVFKDFAAEDHGFFF